MNDKLTYEELEYQVKILAREGVWRKQAVQALEESEEKYRLYFDNAFDIIFSITAVPTLTFQLDLTY